MSGLLLLGRDLSLALRPEFGLRPAGLADVGILAAIVMAATRGRERPQEEWDEPEARIQLEQDLAEESARRAKDSDERAGWMTSVIEANGAPVGRLQVRRGTARVELGGIQVRPDAQGLGIGTAIISDLKSEAAAAGVPLELSVKKGNHGARRLYERLGFQQIGESDDEDNLRWSP